MTDTPLNLFAAFLQSHGPPNSVAGWIESSVFFGDPQWQGFDNDRLNAELPQTNMRFSFFFDGERFTSTYEGVTPDTEPLQHPFNVQLRTQKFKDVYSEMNAVCSYQRRA